MMLVRQDGYAPIEDYGMIADGQSVALVASDGRIDWLAAPRLDSPPFLSSLVDEGKGGWFSVSPLEQVLGTEHDYVGDSMVLRTSLRTQHSVVHVTDALNRGFDGPLRWTELVRRIEIEGEPGVVRWELRPGDRLAKVSPWVHQKDGVVTVLSGDLLAALVTENAGDRASDVGRVAGETLLREGESALIVLVIAQDRPLRIPAPGDVLRRLEHTQQEWQTWARLITYGGEHSDQVVRSALTIRSLADQRTGAMVAAPTTSLPEKLGSSRNYDYRFAWVRDSSFMIDALARLGLTEQVDSSLSWLLRAVQRTAPEVQVLYGLDGRPVRGDEDKLETLDGYRHTGPVTLGNKAASQSQHGAYGDLFGAVSRFVDQGGRLDTETGLTLAALADEVCDKWPRPDAGLWELPEDRMYTSSLINCWVALDRAARLAAGGEIPGLHLERWREQQMCIRDFVNDRCWSDMKRSYTFYAGTDDLDASALLAARNGFCSGNDPRFWSTIDRIRAELTADGPLLYRYSGASQQENAFVACSFWLIEALSYAGRVEEAGDLLRGLLGYGSDLGLWAEEIDPSSGEHRGNYPIGLSHLALIGAVTAYAAAIDGEATPQADGSQPITSVATRN